MFLNKFWDWVSRPPNLTLNPVLPPSHSRGVIGDSRGVSGWARGVVAWTVVYRGRVALDKGES